MEHLSTSAYHHTIEHLEDHLEGLPEFMVACNSDLTKFHLEFNKIKGLLTGCGKGDINFMKYLWRSYKVGKDFEFWEYMKHKNNHPSSTLTVDELIRLASNMYTLCTHKDNHVWESKSPEESEIVALKAEVEQLRGNYSWLEKLCKSMDQQHHLVTPMLSAKTKKEAQGGS